MQCLFIADDKYEPRLLDEVSMLPLIYDVLVDHSITATDRLCSLDLIYM